MSDLQVEHKGTGSGYCTAKLNNGNIINWHKVGYTSAKEGERFSRPKKLTDQAVQMQAQSKWSYDLRRPASSIRRDFSGSGNIITWM